MSSEKSYLKASIAVCFFVFTIVSLFSFQSADSTFFNQKYPPPEHSLNWLGDWGSLWASLLYFNFGYAAFGVIFIQMIFLFRIYLRRFSTFALDWAGIAFFVSSLSLLVGHLQTLPKNFPFSIGGNLFEIFDPFLMKILIRPIFYWGVVIFSLFIGGLFLLLPLIKNLSRENH